MRSRRNILILLCLLLAAGAWFFWPHAKRVAVKTFTSQIVSSFRPGSSAPQILPPKNVFANSAKTVAAAKTNQFAYRLSNTQKSVGELQNDRHAILLENAMIDTRAKLDFSIPRNLQSSGDPGAYIVQANGPVNAAFRAILAANGAQIVSYIPNNAFLVRASSGVASALAANALVQSMIPYEPYYKVQSPLLAYDEKNLPQGAALNLGLFADNSTATISAIEKLGGKILSQDGSPFGPTVRVQPPANWTALAQLPGVLIVEPSYQRKAANDLSRVTVGVTTDTTSGITNNYLGLTGKSVTVEVNDTGIDATHPDFSATGTAGGGASGATRVTGDAAGSLIDTDGHGTHVAGIIAGNGSQSFSPVNVGAMAEGSVSNADFRGKAPLANLYSVAGVNGGNDPNPISDRYFQEAPALTNALISNNSWGYAGDMFYDLHAASFDAAVRDSLSGTSGSQPVLFVFAAGNDGFNGNDGGNGDQDGGGGTPDSISSPGTAKDVITVGALEQLRNITNLVTALDGTSNAVWKPWTDSSSQVAFYSSRGNVGIGTEGTYGRYKPDVVAPGTFVISTRSQQWNERAYYNPSNYYDLDATFQLVDTNALNYYTFPFVVQNNAVSVSLQMVANNLSPVPFPTDMPIYVSLNNFPDPTDPTTYDILTKKDNVTIPPDSGGNINSLQDIINNFGSFNFGVGDSQTFPVNYDLIAQMVTTNDLGNYFQVLSNLNNSISGNPDSNVTPHYYRYESGTSMAAADVSGVLALMQDFFINDTANTNPSPALLKAMLINGARPTGFYNFQVNNPINLEGWGLINLPNSIPASLTNAPGASTGFYFIDQSPTNALATGDTRTYQISLSPGATTVPLRLTLAWTDPPGNPVAAIKLVNNLDLIVTNNDSSTNPIVYYGNDIGANQVFNTQENPTNSSANLDGINNVENIFLPAGAGTNFTVVISGAAVNVNAVTAHTNDIVQDFAFVMSSGNGANTNGFTITSSSASSNPTGDQRITVITGTNASPLLNQFVGASSPLLGTNIVQLGTNASGGQVTLGETNQWHFYVWTNYCGANAAFITFLPPTLATPRGGVFADSDADSTRPEADIDLYVTRDPNLLTLSPTTISNCINGAQVGQSVAGVFNATALDRGGTEFVVDTNSASGAIYYIGVKSEDQMGSEYAFLGLCSDTPFSGLDANGNEYATFYPVDIPDGDATHPGFTNSIALTIYPIEVQRVVVTNILTQQNAGDLVVSINHSTVDNGDNSVVLLNHDSPNVPGTFTEIYDDSGEGDILGAQVSDGPGTLNSFIGQSGMGVWLLHASDNAPNFIGNIQGNLKIEPHLPLGSGVTNTVAGGGWFYDFIDVPAGYSSLNIFGTNVSTTIATPPLQLFLNIGAQPSLTEFLEEADLTNSVPAFPNGPDPGNSIIYGPPLQSGRYWVGVFNPASTPQDVYIIATLTGSGTAPQQTDFDTNGPTLLDDAVTTNSIFVSATNAIVSVNVGLVVNHPRISDLSFTLVSPTGQRVLLMENRGGVTATNLGHLHISTNFFGTTQSGDANASTNVLGPVLNSGTLIIDYNFESIADQMDVYYDGVDIFSIVTNNPGNPPQDETFVIPYGPGTATNIIIVMNQGGNSNTNTAWSYTPEVISRDYNYLTFTEDTNLTTIPIKFAIPPYDLDDFGTNFSFTDFESETSSNYFAPQTNLFTNVFSPFPGWNLSTNNYLTDVDSTNHLSNEVSIVTDPATAQAGSNYLALADGVMSRTIPLTVGRKFTLTYQYRGPGIQGWWRGEGNATDSSNPENNGNNGQLIGRFDFPAGEVGQAFQMEDAGADFEFAGTNTYVQIRQSPSLNVGTNGFTIEGWINPTNISHQEPLVEWLAQTPTNGSDTNLAILAGPFLNRATSHYYYLLRATNWTQSETWATQLGGHLATVDTANEENWIFDTFGDYGTNRNLWIGLNDTAVSGTYIWSSGLTNVFYTNWANAQPDNTCGGRDYTAILNTGNTNQPGLWFLTDNNGFTCPNPAKTNVIYGVVEVTNLQPTGVQFWISVTNTPGTANSLISSNGCLYADLVDVSNVTHEIYSAPGLIQSNIYQHVALTYNTNSGIATLYYNGTNVASSNLTVFVPKTGGDVLLGKDMSLDTNNFYSGKMDEMSIYSRPLSDAEIFAIYEISNLTTNRNVGKFDPSVTPAQGLAEAEVTFGDLTNVIQAENNKWLVQGFTSTATTNSQTLQITGLEPGVLLDSFGLSEAPVGNLYYLPEQSLDELIGGSPHGTWTLEILDSRTGETSTNAQLVNWQLQFVLQTNALATPLPLPPQDPTQITVPPGQTVFLSVAVPSWANFATNILVSATSNVDLLFNPTNPPTGSNPGDFTLLTNSTRGIGVPVLSTTSTPPLPTNSYYLGVRNSGAHAVTAVVEVDFDITVLSNSVPVGGTLNTNDTERYFAFDVSSNAVEATFQLLQLSGNADLVVRKGPPLPTLFSSDYGSFNATNAQENIYLFTNSTPVPLSAGRWYLGVIKRDSGAVNYTILAKELDATGGVGGYNLIPLTNGVPFNFTAGPGAALTNFFSFTVTNSVSGALTNYVGGVRFELYNLSGNGDLTVQTNAPPFGPPFFQTSQNPGRTDELIDIRTNSALTNLAADWYLGVPNNETNLITYTILAEINSNAVFAAFPGAEGAGAGALGGRGGDVYHVLNLNDDGLGSLRYGITSFNGTGAGNVPGTGTTNLAGGSIITNSFGGRTLVFDVSGTIELQSPLIITNSYLTIAGQTSPKGITVAGDMTTVQSAHDVVIRYVRFRPGYLTQGASSTPVDSLKLTNVSEMVADHVSASWSTNDLVSSLNSSNVTVQWSVIADSLNNTNNHGYGSVLRYGNGELNFHHNLYADNYNASPRLGDSIKLDFANNVIYDWGTNAGFSTNETLIDDPFGFTNELNYECNYLIATTNSAMTNIAFFGGTTNTWIFQTNNFMDSNKNGILDGDDIGWSIITNRYTPTNRPFALPTEAFDEAFIAYERVQDFAGDSMGQRDLFDINIVGNVRSQSGTIISMAPLSGLISWWRGEGNGNDSIGTNDATVPAGVTYVNGEVGQCFNFDGTTNLTIADAPSLNPTNGLTIEYWIYIRGEDSLGKWSQSVFTKDDECAGTREYMLNVGDSPTTSGAGDFRAHVGVPSGLKVVDGLTVVQTNTWYHVAETYDGTSLKLYVNGNLDGQLAVSGPIVTTTNPVRIGGGAPPTGCLPYFFNGLLDEPSIYNRALSQTEIQIIYDAGAGGKLFLSTNAPPLDTDRDGIPDYWETTLGENPTNSSANADRNLDGYTDLEEYLNWLGAPHALTVTNTPVSVDLYTLCGKTGKLSFALTNAVNGSVYLTNVLGSVTNTGTYSNSIAVFTPTNNFGGGTNYGFASFGFFVTNNDTIAYFGPVTVSVMVSKVPVLYGSVTALTNGVGTTNNVINPPTTNTMVLASNSIVYFSIFAPTNADFATNILNFASGPLNFWFNQNLLPSGTNAGDFELLTNSMGGTNVIAATNGTPSFIPGQTYYLALQNTNSFAVTNYAVEVDFHLLPAPSVVTNPVNPPQFGAVKVTGSSIQLKWIASSGAQVQVQWTTNLALHSWNTITNPATTTSNGVSTFTDNGSQTAPLGARRFYRLLETSP